MLFRISVKVHFWFICIDIFKQASQPPNLLKSEIKPTKIFKQFITELVCNWFGRRNWKCKEKRKVVNKLSRLNWWLRVSHSAFGSENFIDNPMRLKLDRGAFFYGAPANWDSLEIWNETWNNLQEWKLNKMNEILTALTAYIKLVSLSLQRAQPHSIKKMLMEFSHEETAKIESNFHQHLWNLHRLIN